MDILVKCAQCEKLVIINKKDIDCKIFIHGILKSNGEQIDPHLNKTECENFKFDTFDSRKNTYWRYQRGKQNK